MQSTNLVVIHIEPDQPVAACIEQALQGERAALEALPTMTNVALGDPYLAQQLVELHQSWEVAPQPAQGWLARLRTRLAWWLLGRELQQINRVHATLVRLNDSLIVQLDQERAARRRLEEQAAYEETP